MVGSLGLVRWTWRSIGWSPLETEAVGLRRSHSSHDVEPWVRSFAEHIERRKLDKRIDLVRGATSKSGGVWLRQWKWTSLGRG